MTKTNSRRLEDIREDTGTQRIDARTIFLAGEASVGINTFLNPSPLTPPEDLANDALLAVQEVYPQGVMAAYVRTLRGYGMTTEAKAIEKRYAQLRKIAGLPPAVL